MRNKDGFEQVIPVGTAARMLRKAKGLTLVEVAALMDDGYDASNLSRFERGDQELDTEKFYHLAVALGVTPMHIYAVAMTGDVDVSLDKYYELLSEQIKFKNTRSPVTTTRRVPLISWIQAGSWAGIEDPYAPGDAPIWVITDDDVGPNAFALEVRGDSMTNPNGSPSFPEGTVIVVDPAREARSGQLVIARLDDEQEATFKRLVIDGGAVYLDPLNPRRDQLRVTTQMTICGVVVGRAYERLIDD